MWWIAQFKLNDVKRTKSYFTPNYSRILIFHIKSYFEVWVVHNKFHIWVICNVFMIYGPSNGSAFHIWSHTWCMSLDSNVISKYIFLFLVRIKTIFRCVQLIFATMNNIFLSKIWSNKIHHQKYYIIIII